LVPVQRFHDRDPRQHFRPVALGYQQRVVIAIFRRQGVSQDRPTW